VQWEGVPAEHRERPAARVAGAKLLLAQGQPGQALTLVRPLAEQEGADAHVISLYADALEAAGQGEAAGAQYERALELDSGHPEALVGFAAVLLRAEKLGDALDKLERAERSLRSRTRPPIFRARLLLLKGKILLRQGRNNSSRAREVLEEASRIEGVSPEVWFFLGESLAGLNSPEARNAYTRYLELAPEGQYAQRARRAMR
jgi:Flp pilus assembly protein TadD